MKKVLFLAIATVLVFTTTTAQDTCQCPTKAKVTKRHSAPTPPAKVEERDIYIYPTINMPETPATTPEKEKLTFIVPPSGSNTGLILGIVAMVVLGILGFLIWARSGNGPDTEDIINAIGNNGGKFRNRNMRFESYRPTQTTVALRHGPNEQAQARN